MFAEGAEGVEAQPVCLSDPEDCARGHLNATHRSQGKVKGQHCVISCDRGTTLTQDTAVRPNCVVGEVTWVLYTIFSTSA